MLVKKIIEQMVRDRDGTQEKLQKANHDAAMAGQASLRALQGGKRKFLRITQQDRAGGTTVNVVSDKPIPASAVRKAREEGRQAMQNSLRGPS